MPFIGVINGYNSIYKGNEWKALQLSSNQTWKKRGDPKFLFSGCRITAPRMHDISMCTKKLLGGYNTPCGFFSVSFGVTWAPCTSKDGWCISPSSMAAKVKALYAVGRFPVQFGDIYEKKQDWVSMNIFWMGWSSNHPSMFMYVLNMMLLM